MNLIDEIETEEPELNERSLPDLPVATEQAESATGGGAPNFAGTWTLDKSK